MNPPRIGDTFQAVCPWCSPEKPVTYVVRNLDKRKGKYHLDMLCVSPTNCYRSITGSFDELAQVFHATWLEQTPEGKTSLVKTETVPAVLHSQEWEDRLKPRPAMAKEEREKFERDVVALLNDHSFFRKRDLEARLAKMRPEASAVNLSFLNHLRVAFPEFSSLIKSLRMSGKVKFAVHYGHHVFGKGTEVETSTAGIENEAHHRLRRHVVRPGPIQVTVVFYLPVTEERDIEHFLQAVFPRPEVRTPFHRITLLCGFADRKKNLATFRLDESEWGVAIKPHRLELTARLDERDLALSLMKAILMGSVIAREATCTARQEHKLLMHKGQPHVPSIVLIHNNLPHSDELWKTEYNNLHRSFHAFAEFDGTIKRSVSQRVIMSHSQFPVSFNDEEVTAHLEKFQILFLREFISALGSEDVYVPPSVLRAYAPRGGEIESLVAELTGLYEERLKKAALEREKLERGHEQVLNRNNFWLTVMFLLFSIAQATEQKWLNWLIAGLAGVFVVMLAWRSVRGEQKKRYPNDPKRNVT